jgi:hypothetical protein
VATIRYTDFDVEVATEPDGFRASVLKSPAGEGASVRFPAVDPAALTTLLGSVGSARDAVHVHQPPPIATLDTTKGFGGDLYRTVFGGDVGASLRASLRESARRSVGLRIRLRIPAALGDIPWEYLFHEELDRFLCLSAETPIVRYLETFEPVRVVRVKRPLRILVMISSPSDHRKLDVEGEFSKLEGALAGPIDRGLIALERVHGASMVALHERLLEADWHVFHFIGHGGFDAEHGDGLLVLEGPDGKGVLVPGDDLGTALHDHKPLRLAVLNSCEGARGSRKDPFAGTAQGLIQQRVPAVIAMQFAISDAAAKIFAERFYASLAHGSPVDAALGEARKTIYLGGNRLEWATPVLYMRAANGRIFDVEGADQLEAKVVDIEPLASDAAAGVPAPTAVVADGKVLHLDDPHGARLEAAVAEPAPHHRRPPLDLRPKDFPDLLGRDAEVRSVTAAFLSDVGTSTEPVEIYGPAGAGKTALVRNVAHHPAGQFPDGVVYSSSRQPAPDLLRFLFQTFYETPEPFMPSEAELRRHLHDVKALVQLDDVDLERDELEMVTNVVPSCLFLLSSERRVLFEEGPSVPVRGLPEAAALQLLERRLGRALAPEEATSARELVGELARMPLLVVQAASRMVDDGLTVEQVAAEVRARAPAETPALKLSLSEPELRAMAVLAAARAPVGVELVVEATGLADAQAVLEGLKDRGLVQSHSPRYSLVPDLHPVLIAEVEAAWQDSALDAITSWAEDRSSSDPYLVLEEAEALMGFLRWAEERSRWPSVIRLGKALERPLALAARWWRWREVLASMLRAARAEVDPAQEAWALHQLGTRSVGLAQITEGRADLLEALRIRETTGDQAGAAATRHNLGFAGGAPEPVDHGGGGGGGSSDDVDDGPRWWLRILIALVVVAAGGGAAVALWPNPADETVGISFTPASLEFGEQQVDTPSAAKPVTIESTGAVALDLGHARIRPPGSGFSLAGDTCSGVELPEGGRCTLQVAFQPPAAGERSATLLIGSNAEGGRLEIPLSGTGLPGDETTGPVDQVPVLELEPSDGLVFVDRGQKLSVTISNSGSAQLELRSATIFPADLAETQYVIEADPETPCVAPLQPGESCVLQIGFLGAPGLESTANLVIDSNATLQPVYYLLSGEAHASLTLGPWPDSYEAPQEAVATLQNTGTAPFDVDVPFIEDPSGLGVYTITENTCTRVAIGGSCTITVLAEPPCDYATYEATLVVPDSTLESRHEAALSYVEECVE